MMRGVGSPFPIRRSATTGELSNACSVQSLKQTTEGVLLQQRQAFHLDLEEELRDLADPLAVKETASRVVDRALDVARVGYGEIDDGERHVRVERDWTDAVL